MAGCRNVCIIVIGDIGRSPRMEYHAMGFLGENFNVDLIGYVETKPLEELCTAHPKCKIHKLTPVPMTNIPRILRFIFKVFWQTLTLLIALASIRRPDILLVQNPPGIPVLLIAYLYCKLARVKFVIDWHNYTYTILALEVAGGERSRICRLAKWLEQYFGARADAHLCVTKAMQKDLQSNWNICNSTVLYDRPSEQFRPIGLVEKHELFMKLSKEYPQFLSKESNADDVVESTALTQKLIDGTVVYKKERLAILVSSTSWTPDEDFNLLLSALEDYERAATDYPDNYPHLLCIISGKGPQKESYEIKFSELNWKNVTIITPWLETEDYPKVLAAADLGVCLHWSSSGLDLPMKVLDMFGCGLPVCAYNFKCLNELITSRKNGFIFENRMELATLLKTWFSGFPDNPEVDDLKKTLRINIEEFQTLRWRENWMQQAFPVFNALVEV